MRCWRSPIPVARQVVWGLVMVTGAGTVLTVANLAIRGLGAPFAVKLSSRPATDCLYAWTRYPMVLCNLRLVPVTRVVACVARGRSLACGERLPRLDLLCEAIRGAGTGDSFWRVLCGLPGENAVPVAENKTRLSLFASKGGPSKKQAVVNLRVAAVVVVGAVG